MHKIYHSHSFRADLCTLCNNLATISHIIPMSEKQFPTLCERERSAPIQQGASSPRVPPSQRDLLRGELKSRTKRCLFFWELHQRVTSPTTTTAARTRGRVQPCVSRIASTVPSQRCTSSRGSGWGSAATDGGGVAIGGRYVSPSSRAPLKSNKRVVTLSSSLSWNQ